MRFVDYGWAERQKEVSSKGTVGRIDEPEQVATHGWKVERNSETPEAIRGRGVAETKWEAYKLAVPDIVGTKEQR